MSEIALRLVVGARVWEEMFTLECEGAGLTDDEIRTRWGGDVVSQAQKLAFVHDWSSARRRASGPYVVELSPRACEHLAYWILNWVSIWRESCELSTLGAYCSAAQSWVRKLEAAGHRVNYS